jgi:large subunit ribosomal protein L29
MPSKKFLELQEYNDADLGNELTELQAQYQKLKFEHAIKGLDNPLTLKVVRRDIARLKTEVSRREVAGLDAAGLAKRTNKRARRK